MENKLIEMQMQKLAENYAKWLFNDCFEPISEVMWLVECALKSERREEVLNILKIYGYEK